MTIRIRRRTTLVLILIAMCGIAAVSLHYWSNRDPKSIPMDPAMFDDFVGTYGENDMLAVDIRREGDRLMRYAPERAPAQLFPATETTFFMKGKPQRWSFHRASSGHVDSAVVTSGKYRQDYKRSPLSSNAQYKNGIVAATTGGDALQVGIELLKEGGSAADAAMATALAEVVIAAGSYVSAAGVMCMLYYDADSRRVHYMDACYNVPENETDPKSIPRQGGRTALVPGFMAGVQAAHDKFGKVPFERVLRPAITLARQGQEVKDGLMFWIAEKKSVLSRFPETKKIFVKNDGMFYGWGDWLRQPELANTLEQVSEHGAKYMYSGEWGQKFVQAVQKADGKITQADMDQYEVIWEDPLKTSYHGFDVFAPGLAARGGIDAVQNLNLLDHADLRQYGHFTTSSQSLFWFMETIGCQCLLSSLSQFDGIDLSPQASVTTETAARIWEKMHSGKWHYRGKDAAQKKSAHSDGIVVVDQWGNMAAVTHSINTRLWGDTGLFVDGVSIPDSAGFQQHRMRKVGPGKRLPHEMAPLVVLKDGRAMYASSAVGSPLMEKTMQVLVSVLDFGMLPQQAIDTPMFITRNYSGGFGFDAGFSGEVERDGFDDRVVAGVEDLGLKVKVVESSENKGYCVAVCRDLTTGTLTGGRPKGLQSGVAGY